MRDIGEEISTYGYPKEVKWESSVVQFSMRPVFLEETTRQMVDIPSTEPNNPTQPVQLYAGQNGGPKVICEGVKIKMPTSRTHNRLYHSSGDEFRPIAQHTSEH